MALDESRNASTRDDWRTPPEWIALVRKALGEITLDPCADVNPEFHFAKVNRTQNGLDWAWYDGFFCNPPYGHSLPGWAGKAVEEWSYGREGIFLSPARPETAWSRLLMEHATLVMFPKRRIKFIDPTGDGRNQPKMPNMLTYFGRRPRQVTGVFLESCTVLLPALEPPF